ncbi:hypothetical protein BJX64DRAFT_300242 [Aspergillus heterothallicus]
MASGSNFMFIDSQADHAQNLSLRTKKQVFVMKKYYKDQKQASIDRLNPKSAPTSRPRVNNTTTEAPSSPVEEPENTTIQRRSKDCSREFDSPEPEMWSMEAYLSQGFVDPFSSSAIEMTDTMNQYFHHFRIHSILMCYPIDPMGMGMWWWQQAITQPGLLQAILFLSAGHRAALEFHTPGVNPQVAEKTFRNCLRLRGNVLRNLKDTIEDPKTAVAESTTLVVSSLASGEAVNANFEALEIHMKGLKRLVRLLGGVEKIDHGALAKIYECDVRNAALNNTKPVFPISSRWRSEIRQFVKFLQVQEPLQIPNKFFILGKFFFKASWYSGLDPQLQFFTQILHRLIIHYEEAQLNPSIITHTDNDLYLVFEHQLLSASYAPAEDKIDEALRHAFLVYVNLRIWHFQGIPLMHYIVDALRQSLEPPFTHLQGNAPDLLFWILWIGGLASFGAGCHGWFLQNLTTIARQLRLENWEAARLLLGGFFYTDQAWEGDKVAEQALWNEVVPETQRALDTPMIFI